MLKITRSRHRLTFNMGIPIPGKDGLYIEAGLDAYICHWSLTLLFHVILKYAEQRTETCQAVPSYIDMHCSYKAVNKCRYMNLKHKTMEISSQRVSQLDDEISVSLHGELRAYHRPSGAWVTEKFACKIHVSWQFFQTWNLITDSTADNQSDAMLENADINF